MNLLLFLAKGFETMEASVFIDIMGWARDDYGVDIHVTTCGFTPTVVSAFGVPVLVDVLLDDADPAKYDALALPGGFERFGFFEEGFDEALLSLIRAFDAQNKPIASVCVGALLLGKSGILRGRRATTYHLEGKKRQTELAGFGAIVLNEPVVTDRNVTTSYCPQTAPFVAFALLARLAGKPVSDRVRQAMGWPQAW